MLSRDGEVADDALALAVLGAEGDPLRRSASTRAAQPDRAARRPRRCAGVGAVGAEQQPGQLGASGAEQPGEADAPRPGAPSRSAGAMAPVRPSPVAASTGVSGRSATSVGRLAVEVGRARPARGRSSWRPAPAAAASAIAYSPTSRPLRRIVDAVGDLVDLVEEVRDEQDRDAGVAQVADHPEQLARPRRRRGWRSARRGSAPRRRGRPPGRWRRAAGRRGGGAEHRVRVDAEVEPGEELGGPAADRAPVDAPQRRGSRPSRMFSATVRFGQRFTSW